MLVFQVHSLECKLVRLSAHSWDNLKEYMLVYQLGDWWEYLLAYWSVHWLAHNLDMMSGPMLGQELDQKWDR